MHKKQYQSPINEAFNPANKWIVERVNGKIKNNTILKNEYQGPIEMNKDLIGFMCFYNLFRRHGSLRKELKVRTPIDAVNKWFNLKPELFKEKSEILHQKLINLQKQNNQILTTTL